MIQKKLAVTDGDSEGHTARAGTYVRHSHLPLKRLSGLCSVPRSGRWKQDTALRVPSVHSRHPHLGAEMSKQQELWRKITKCAKASGRKQKRLAPLLPVEEHLHQLIWQLLFHGSQPTGHPDFGGPDGVLAAQWLGYRCTDRAALLPEPLFKDRHGKADTWVTLTHCARDLRTLQVHVTVARSQKTKLMDKQRRHFVPPELAFQKVLRHCERQCYHGGYCPLGG